MTTNAAPNVTENPYSAERLAKIVHTEMVQNGLDRKRAVIAAVDEIRRNPIAWIDGCGYAMVSELVQVMENQGHRPVASDGKVQVPDNWGTSRMDLRNGDVRLVDIVWPVGNTGETKRLGEFTSEDLQATGQLKVRQAKNLKRKGRAFLAAADHVPEGRTLGQSIGIMPDEVRKRLDQAVRGS